MSLSDFSPEVLSLLNAVTAKRARTMIQHIIAHGHITSEEISTLYGYSHPPRAIRDVREQGIPIETGRTRDSAGRIIAVYRFGDFSEIKNQMLRGRTTLTRRLKSDLIERDGARCNVYLVRVPENDLQIDHRVPFHIAGDQDVSSIDGFQLLCRPANRDKAWTCQHCPNWEQRELDVCRTCYWAYPESYEHVATKQLRRLDILWGADEISDYEDVKLGASRARLAMAEYVKSVLRSTPKEPPITS